MKANYRFITVSIVLSCLTCAGTTFALVTLDTPSHSSRPLTGSAQLSGADTINAEVLRPSLGAGPELLVFPNPQPVTRPSRLSFFDSSLGELELPDEFVTAAANPESWSVEVNELPVTSTRPRSPVDNARSSRSSKAANRKTKIRHTLKSRLEEISPTALNRLTEKFEAAKASWPPAEVALVAIKDEKALELYARPADGPWTYVHRYKVLAASGSVGPKLLRGDKQVPEGVYRISYLNPNSAYHVSLRVNYPNMFDREMAAKDGRKDLGGDIMIHGKNLSAGCLAVGDASAEELFVLAAEVGMKDIKVVIAPTDFRRKDRIAEIRGPDWLPQLYGEIATAMGEFKRPPPPTGLLSLLGL